MAPIVGVHGIAQEQLGRHQIAPSWRRAMRDGLERAAGAKARKPRLDIAFYGDVFLEATTGKSAAEPDGLLSDLADDEVAELTDAALEMADEMVKLEAIGLMPLTEPKAVTKTVTWTPGPLQAAFRTLDRWFSPSRAVLGLGELRQVGRYLNDWRVKERVDRAVAAAIDPDCRILVGHSLGSVVALEHIRQNPDHPFDLFLSLGSPLGLRMVRDRLEREGYPAIGRWVNVRDRHDPVACAGDLSLLWEDVEDRVVGNGPDTHSVTKYLSKRVSGRAILDAAPELGSA